MLKIENFEEFNVHGALRGMRNPLNSYRKQLMLKLTMIFVQELNMQLSKSDTLQNNESDVVNHPNHYQGKVECIDCLDSATAGLDGIEAVCTANAMKYLFRWKRKNGVEDLRKCLWYVNHLIEHLEKEQK